MKPKKRIHDPKWKDSTKATRQSKRTAALNEAAGKAGFFIKASRRGLRMKQGRKPQGLTRWNGRLTTASLEELKAKAKMLDPYYTVNDLVRIAVDRYVCTELLNP